MVLPRFYTTDKEIDRETLSREILSRLGDGDKPSVAHHETIGEGALFHCHITAPRVSTGPYCIVDYHWHAFIELIYMLSGKAFAIINGEEHTLLPGDLLFINSRENHTIFGWPETAYVCLRIAPDLPLILDEETFRNIMPLHFRTDTSLPRRYFRAQDIATTPLPYLVLSIVDEFHVKEAGYEWYMHSLVSQLYLRIYRFWIENGLVVPETAAGKQQYDVRLRKLFGYIDQNYAEKLTLRDAVHITGLSYSYLSRFFHDSIGQPFTAYLTNIRLLEAEKLLLSTDMSIVNIALETGFGSSSYFTAKFKESRGVTPSEFRARFQGQRP